MYGRASNALARDCIGIAAAQAWVRLCAGKFVEGLLAAPAGADGTHYRNALVLFEPGGHAKRRRSLAVPIQ
jgi:hypothetical protein